MGLNQHDLKLKLEGVKFISVLITERNEDDKESFSVKIRIGRRVFQLLTARGHERLFQSLNTVIKFIKGLPVKKKQILISLNGKK